MKNKRRPFLSNARPMPSCSFRTRIWRFRRPSPAVWTRLAALTEFPNGGSPRSVQYGVFDSTSSSRSIGSGRLLSRTSTSEREVGVSPCFTLIPIRKIPGRLELVIKVYRDGKLTSYLARLPLNATVEVAGPKGAMRYHRGLCRHLGMVAGGSGITPMYQVIRAVCEDERDDTTISLLYANRTEEDILLRAELDAFACRYPAKFRVHYVLDRPPAGWSFSSGYVTREMIAQYLPAAGPDTKILLCGPPGMIQATTAHLAELGFARPGALSKPVTRCLYSDTLFILCCTVHSPHVDRWRIRARIACTRGGFVVYFFIIIFKRK